MNKRTAFTMIELIYVIVVIGILAMIAIPRMGGAVIEAHIGKAKSDVAAVRAAIASERQARFLKGSSAYISALDHQTATPADGVAIFDSNNTDGNFSNGGPLLTYGIITGSNEGQWKKIGVNKYTFKSQDATATFDYNATTGIFTCTTGADANGTLCGRIIN